MSETLNFQQEYDNTKDQGYVYPKTQLVLNQDKYANDLQLLGGNSIKIYNIVEYHKIMARPHRQIIKTNLQNLTLKLCNYQDYRVMNMNNLACKMIVGSLLII